MSHQPTIEQIVSLAKRRGFIFPDSEIYGGVSNTWDYGPLGVELKNNIKQLWWKFFVHEREDVYGLESALIMNPKVWETSGHIKNFSDPLVECTRCHQRFRAEDVPQETKCSACGGALLAPRQFNTMFQTFIGPAQDTANVAYLRPETAQGMFVAFKNICDAYSPRLPFGIAQIGKAFRNEITPGNFIFRTREFEQMELEYFIHSGADWNAVFETWLSRMKEWMNIVGVDESRVSYYEVPQNDRAHYSKRTVDIEFEFPFGKKELYGIAYRSDFDLKNHQEASGERIEYFDAEKNERLLPHVIEPSFGVERTLLAVLCSAYKEHHMEKEVRTYLDLPFALAPYKAAVFPLLANKPELVSKAREVLSFLKEGSCVGPIAFDDGGNIGKRYRKQDEIGTPYCITIDFQTLEDDTVTIRDRNTATQERVAVTHLFSKIFPRSA